MEPAGDVTAPELELDDKSQYGFVQWYKALSKVALQLPGCSSLLPGVALAEPAKSLIPCVHCTGQNNRQIF